MTRKSLRDDAIELGYGDQRLYVPFMRLYFYAVAMLLHVLSERSFAPAAEHKIWTALLWRWGTAIMGNTPLGATTSQGEEHIMYTMYSASTAR